MQPYLTKSRYLAGLQCHRRLWLQQHRPDFGDDTESSFTVTGREVGELARRLYPGGAAVAASAWAHTDAVARTRELMADPAVPAIFEAAFEAYQIRVRVDVLVRLDGERWGIREVKSGTGVKDHHLDDVAVQLFVLEACGVAVGDVQVLFVDRGYRLDTGGLDVAGFFARQDVTAQARARQQGLAARADDQLETLAQDAEPAIEPSPHCKSPYLCEFWPHCTQDKPDDWIMHLPQLQRARFDELADAGIERMTEIPPGAPLSDLQHRVRRVHATGEPYVDPGLAAALGRFGPPAHYLDFEALNPAIPIYPGTTPYTQVPFQWSLHSRDEAHHLRHAGFLAAAEGDPRRPLAESLIEAVGGDDWPIVVYSGFEARILTGLMDPLRDLRDDLAAIQNRLVDLYRLIAANVYLPAFAGSFSIKAVGPALAPEVDYGELDGIADGTAAMQAFETLVRGRIGGDAAARTRAELDAYCELDTLAMVRVHDALRRLAGLD